MYDETPEDPVLEQRQSRLRLLYEPLSLLDTLDQTRGDRIRPDDVPSHDAEFSLIGSQRSFVNAIAYICAYKKGPAYVTAAALEKAPEEIVLWLAANKGIEPAVIDFLNPVVKIITWLVGKTSARLENEEGASALNLLTGKTLSFNSPRIYSYYCQIVNHAAPDVVPELARDPRFRDIPKVIEFRKWLASHLYEDDEDHVQLQERDMERLAKKCYESRKLFNVLRNLGGDPRQTERFEHLYKLLGKLGKHVVMCKRLVEASIVLRTEFLRGLTVKTVPRSRERQIPLRRKCNVDGIANRIFRKPTDRDRFIARLETIYTADDLNKRLECQYGQTKTFVHAELLLFNHLDTIDGDYLDNSDKYVGCSKPACYLCYQYICTHPGGYARPPSHQKLYLRWRLPDIKQAQPLAAILFQRQKEVLEKMIITVRSDLNNEVATRVGRRKSEVDSTHAETSSLYEIKKLEDAVASMSFAELLREIDPSVQHTPLPDLSSETEVVSSPSSSSQYSPAPDSAYYSSDSDGGVGI
ncbi:hypothetical protein P168DRAFT_9359 [Aspergillus campestris IBT 28561]|uniref:Uncharacterized protein n=1 Tax=Aspergillus campestris (strain IBT 28561) TaxID=1392248 RepID=A0A2I1DE16_ASPC2|nr:uncharacterized protein P168DRAFT_9359 [Aspergillus campestris IBT 28561]PKY08129.1 hypothetical protein P168DRAFT_9359 [Aspergillus campestris IBT 28561]